MQSSILDPFPQADISGSIVWINMLRQDSEAAAHHRSQVIQDARIRHFYDPQRQAGLAIAQGLLSEEAGPAWDIYLFYQPGVRWIRRPPRPFDWVHQLSGGQRADPLHYRSGEQLMQALRRRTERLLEASQGDFER